MSLSRHYDDHGVRWQVDGSNLLVCFNPANRTWEVDFFDPTGTNSSSEEYLAYLERHSLCPVGFKSRARAVDAVRMALAGEPLLAPARTRWKRVGEGEYLSTDGRWQLLRSPGRAQLVPRTALAEKVVESKPRFLPLLGWSHRLTLHLIALHTDWLNQELGLTGSGPEAAGPPEAVPASA